MVEVMMASLVLMVGFVGLIEAITVTANSQEHARRQTLAVQILNHEIEKLYLLSWGEISALPTTSANLAIDTRFNEARQALGDNLTANTVVRFTLARTMTSPDPVTNVREANFTVTWVVTTSRRDAGGNPVRFTQRRSSSAWYGKYGLPLSYQKS